MLRLALLLFLVTLASSPPLAGQSASPCPGKPVTGPVPASFARDLCLFITEAAATQHGDVLIIMVTRSVADQIMRRSLDIQDRPDRVRTPIEGTLIGMGTRWSAVSPWSANSPRASRLEVYWGRVHLATVSRSLWSGKHEVHWHR